MLSGAACLRFWDQQRSMGAWEPSYRNRRVLKCVKGQYVDMEEQAAMQQSDYETERAAPVTTWHCCATDEQEKAR